MTDMDARRIHEQWHEAVRKGDLEGVLALYAEDATLETPLALVVLDGDAPGILKGKSEIQRFLTAGVRVLPKDVARWYRTGAFFANGRQLSWEYPRATPDGDQIDLVEMMDIEHGRIAHHRVYWGWFGVRLLLQALKTRPDRPASE